MEEKQKIFGYARTSTREQNEDRQIISTMTGSIRIIFFYEHDKFGQGLPMYHVDRMVLETEKTFEDGSHIIYVNGKYKGDDEICALSSRSEMVCCFFYALILPA